MKSKIQLLIAVLSFLVIEANAFTIVMQGGGRNSRFDYVSCTRNNLTCRGCGNLVCPVCWGQANLRGVSIELTTVVDHVESAIKRGQTSGSTLLQNVFPIKWSTIKDGYQVEIEADEVITTNHE